MKLKQYELSQYLRDPKKLATLFIIAGDEPLLVEEACAEIRKKAFELGFNERDFNQADNNYDWQQLKFIANSFSLFSERKLIELHVLTPKFTAEAVQVLQELAGNIPQDKLILIRCPKLGSDTVNTTWFKEVEKQAIFITVWPMTNDALPRYIKTQLQAQGLQADPEGIQFLMEYTHNNLLALQQEIFKLSLLFPSQKLKLSDIVHALVDGAHFDIFEFADACLQGHSKQVVRILNGLRAEAIEPTLILWALVKEIRLLANLTEQVEAGQERQALLKQHGVWDKRKPIVTQAMTRHKSVIWKQCLTAASQVDKAIKGYAKGDVWLLLLNLALTIAGTPVIPISAA